MTLTTWFRRHSTGLTFAGVVGISLALSVAPVPEALRPFPELASPSEGGAVFAERLGLRHARRLAARLSPSATQPPAARPSQVKVPASVEDLPDFDEPPTFHISEALTSLNKAAREEANGYEEVLAELAAAHVEVEQGCRIWGEDGLCKLWALDSYFDDLEALRRGKRNKPVRVVHLGDSLIASDYITEKIRERLQVRHGSGGKGFLFVDRPTTGAGRTVRTGKASPGWRPWKMTEPGYESYLLGFSGVTFAAPGQADSAVWETGGAKLAELFFLSQPKGGELEVKADEQVLGKVKTSFSRPEPALARVRLPSGNRRFQVVAKRGPVQLYGVSLESGGPGVVYDSIGLPGATAKVYLRTDAAAFKKQLGQRAPSLVVVMLGGNEAYEYSKGQTTQLEALDSFKALVGRIRSALPDASCLLSGTLDAGHPKMNGMEVRRGSREMSGVVRQVALNAGCAYWDALTAMGGLGSIAKWAERGLMNTDLVHPRAKGADLLGHLLDVALERAYQGRRDPTPIPRPPGLRRPRPEVLSRVFGKLRELEQGRRDRVGVVQLGASHTAAHHFTDEVRRQLTARFGDRGRGYVAAGRSSPLLVPTGVRRALEGTWEISDALEAPPGEVFGLTGVRVQGQSGSAFEISFCTDCPPRSAKAKVELHYLAQPDMGKGEVLLDGKPVAELAPPAAGSRPAAKVLLLDAESPNHQLTIKNSGPGPLSIFGVASEVEERGLVYDSLGLPSATVMTLASMDQASLISQLKARKVDLYVLFYGTNESGIESLDLDQMRRSYDLVFSSFKEAAPDADCLILSATDRMTAKERKWVEAPSQSRVIASVEAIANEKGCAFWPTREAMGGPRSIERWLRQQPSLANADRVHLTSRGYKALASSFVSDLLTAYEASQPLPIHASEKVPGP